MRGKLILANLIVPTLTRYDLLERLLSSIQFPVRHLLIIDNGGNWRRSFNHDHAEQTTILRMPANLGVAGSWNLGVKSFPHAPYWAFTSDDAFFRPGTLAAMADTQPADMLMAQEAPHWQAFTVGEEVIRRVGLWCEGFHPAYFEDNDFQRRATEAGIVMKQVLKVGHINSSTLNGSESFQQRNRETFLENQELHIQRSRVNVMNAGEWDLDRRRRLEWLR